MHLGGHGSPHPKNLLCAQLTSSRVSRGRCGPRPCGEPRRLALGRLVPGWSPLPVTGRRWVRARPPARGLREGEAGCGLKGHRARGRRSRRREAGGTRGLGWRGRLSPQERGAQAPGTQPPARSLRGKGRGAEGDAMPARCGSAGKAAAVPISGARGSARRSGDAGVAWRPDPSGWEETGGAGRSPLRARPLAAKAGPAPGHRRRGLATRAWSAARAAPACASPRTPSARESGSPPSQRLSRSGRTPGSPGAPLFPQTHRPSMKINRLSKGPFFSPKARPAVGEGGTTALQGQRGDLTATLKEVIIVKSQ